MKPWKLVIFLFLFSSYALGQPKNMHVTEESFGEVLATFMIPIKNEAYSSKEVWRSPKGIACSAHAIPQKNGNVLGSYQCITPQKFKSQVSVDCSKNTNRETAMYLFFGQVGDANEIGNFYVWCE